MSFLRRNLYFRVEIHLICNYDTSELLASILLFDACVPIVKKAERFGVCGVEHEHHLVSFA